LGFGLGCGWALPSSPHPTAVFAHFTSQTHLELIGVTARFNQTSEPTEGGWLGAVDEWTTTGSVTRYTDSASSFTHTATPLTGFRLQALKAESAAIISRPLAHVPTDAQIALQVNTSTEEVGVGALVVRYNDQIIRQLDLERVNNTGSWQVLDLGLSLVTPLSNEMSQHNESEAVDLETLPEAFITHNFATSATEDLFSISLVLSQPWSAPITVLIVDGAALQLDQVVEQMGWENLVAREKVYLDTNGSMIESSLEGECADATEVVHVPEQTALTQLSVQICRPESIELQKSARVSIEEIHWIGGVRDFRDEWVVLRNHSSQPISVAGWSVTGLGIGGGDVNLPETSMLEAYEAIVISRYVLGDHRSSLNPVLNQTTQALFWHTPLSLPNTQPNLVLQDTNGEIIDAVQLSHWPAGGMLQEKRVSMRRLSLITNGSDPSSWHSCVSRLCQMQAPNYWQDERILGLPTRSFY
jgi:hypothetical protein